MTDAKSKIRVNTTTFKPEDIHSIVDAVQTGGIPIDLPTGAVTMIKKKLEKDPNWRGDDLAHMSLSNSELDIYELKIKPALFFESSQQAKIDGSSSSSSALLGANETNPKDLTASSQTTSIQNAVPVLRKVMSSERTNQQAFSRRSFDWERKPISSDRAVDQLGLHSLSMSGADTDAERSRSFAP